MIGSRDIKDLFNDLIELPDEARRAYLDGRCGNDPALRERVVALLGAYQTAGALLAEPTMGNQGGPGDAAAAFSAVGQRVGPYQLLERIGEGGFGSVYMAEQREPVQRTVAF